MHKREVKLSGHIIDSLILPKALDLIMDMGGDFKILEFSVGKLKGDISDARILVEAENKTLLGEILDELSEIGALVIEIKDVKLLISENDKTLPADFYSTTHHTTQIRYKNEWVVVEDIEMDCMIVVDPESGKATCKPIGMIKKGDLVVVGSGIKMGKWTKATMNFLKKNKDALSKRKVALFVTCGAANEEKTIAEGQEKYLDNVAKENLINEPIATGLFGSVYDPNAKQGLIFKLVNRSIKKELEKQGKDPNKRYDYRNWDEIRAWAKKLTTKP